MFQSQNIYFFVLFSKSHYCSQHKKSVNQFSLFSVKGSATIITQQIFNCYNLYIQSLKYHKFNGNLLSKKNVSNLDFLVNNISGCRKCFGASYTVHLQCAFSLSDILAYICYHGRTVICGKIFQGK